MGADASRPAATPGTAAATRLCRTSAASGGGAAAGAGTMLAHALIGLLAGALVLAAVETGRRMFARRQPA